MSDRRTPLGRLIALLGLTVLALGMTAGVSRADPFGELSHFADKAGELKAPEAALGVNPEDNSLYVVDKLAEGEFRLEKFEKGEGGYKQVASAIFNPKAPNEAEAEVEGVAIDPTMNRVYVLALVERREGVKIDTVANAASELYAFSTKQSGSKLEPVEGIVGGVLTPSSVLKPNSNSYGVSILEPGGIAVNPVNHQILIAGYEDLGKKVPATQEIPVVQAIEPTGALAAKWSDDKSSFFEECGCINSPAVTASGHILVIGEEDEIDELPSNLSPTGEVKRVYALPTAAVCAEIECPYVEKLTGFPGEGAEAQGAQMSIGPEGDIYLRDRIRLAAEEGFKNSGVMILSPSFVEQGFIGGGSPASESGACAANDRTGAKPVIAAGKNKEVFLLSRPEFKPAKIIAFGEGGANCPHGTASTPTAKAGGVKLEKFPLAAKVTFSSTMTQANAVSEIWEFADGSEPVHVNERQQETTLVEHKFLKAGRFKVLEKITTDNLATPEIIKGLEITVLGAPAVKGERVKIAGEEATLEAEVNPNAENTTCEFEYGPVGQFTSKLACPNPPGEGEEFVSESKTVKLEAGKEYNFRLVAKSLSGETTPEPGTKFFMGPGGAPTAETLGSGELGATTASVHGSVNPKGVATTCKFEYGTTTSYGRESACAPQPGSGEAAVAVSAALKELSSSTTYHYRVVAENSGGKRTVGADKEFKTSQPSGPPKSPPPVEKVPLSGGGVLPHQETKEPPPAVRSIAGSSITVSKSGLFALKLSCPAGVAQCSGTVAVKTASAVAASLGFSAGARKSILTLATVSFTIAGGGSKTVTLHLSAKAKTLLAKLHTIRARATIVAQNPEKASAASTVSLTLKKHR